MLALLLAACRPPAHDSSGIDRDLAACIPADTVSIAGANLNDVRAAPKFRDLVPPAFANVSYVIVAWNGKELLLIERGQSEGAKSIGPNLSLAGAPAMMDAAEAQHRSGRSGAPDLLAQAHLAPVWGVLRGGAPLPLTGNAANLNRLLRLTDFVSLSASVKDRIEADLEMRCPTEAAARQLEESFRGIVSLAAAAAAKRLEMAEVRREGATVNVRLSVLP